jgi:ribonucleoside-diphosphate reductase alpha chain
MFSYDEALKASLEYFDGNELAAKVFVDKYALKNNNGNFLEQTPEDMHRRLAKEFARIEKNKFKEPLTEEFIFSLLDKFKYIVPQGSPMYGIGNNYTHQSLGNCFVLGQHPYDSYGGICYADQMLVQLSKRRCGVGICLDNIRPKGLPTKNAAKTTDGIAVFMERFSNSIREVAQSGRRGASLQSLNVHHPEIETFIKIKQDLTKVTGANVSVLVTDEFMQAVKEDKEYEQRWPVDSDKPSISKMVKAKDIWDLIIECAHKSAEPGVIWIDRARDYGLSNRYSVLDIRYRDSSGNPCGEIIMGFDACRLLLENLYSYVINPFTDSAYFDYELFGQHVEIAQRLMDDLVDLEIEKIDDILKKIESDPEPEYIKAIEREMWQSFRETALLGRRTGLGITALGDCLAALNIKYGSEHSITVTNEIYRKLAIHSMISSCMMAKELGAFPLYDEDIERQQPFLRNLFETSPEVEHLHKLHGRRNISLTTTAPAGTVSIVTETSSGIEPVFMLEYTRRRKIPKDSKKPDFVDKNGDCWENNTVRHKGLQDWMNITGETEIEKSPYYKATANDIDWEKSVDIQAVAQKWITHSISKTCNLPKSVTKELVDTIYLRAYDKGLKGFTIYRDGCRDGVMFATEDNKEKISIEKRPTELECELHHVSVKGEKFWVCIGLSGGTPYEVFAGRGALDPDLKYGKIIKTARPKGYKAVFDEFVISPLTIGCLEHESALLRMLSTSLRHGIEVRFIIEQLEKSTGDITSFTRALARALKKYIIDGEEIKGEICPDCGGKLVMSESCYKCSSCSFSRCN